MKASLFDRAAPALSALALCGTLGLAAPALAQNAGAPGAAPPAAAAAPASPTAWVQQQNERLHAQLRITPAQEEVWNQFAAVSRANAEDMEKLYQDRSAHFQTMNAADNLKNYLQIVQTQAADMGKKVEAFDSLYNALSPEQKQIVDRLFHYQEGASGQQPTATTGGR